RQRSAAWSRQQRVASSRQRVYTVLAMVVGNRPTDWNQLTFAGGIAEPQNLNSYSLNGIALFIEHAPGDCSQRHDPDDHIAHSLSGRKSQGFPGALRRSGAINLAGEAGFLHPKPVIPRLKLNSKVAVTIGICADRRW